MNKIITVDEAVSFVKDGMTIMIGGFLGSGTAINVVDALARKNVQNLTLISNDTAFPNQAIGKLIANHQIKKLITSHIGTNADTIQQFNDKILDIEFVPQGTLMERIRCGGAGLGGVLTPTGVGTVVAEGKRILEVNGKEYLLELPLHADVAIIGASICDKMGNCVYKGTTHNCNPTMATAADVVIAEAKQLVEVGEIPMEQIHTPGIYIDYIVEYEDAN